MSVQSEKCNRTLKNLIHCKCEFSENTWLALYVSKTSLWASKKSYTIICNQMNTAKCSLLRFIRNKT